MAETITPNVELIQRTLDHIHDNPKEWSQVVWGRGYTCGTAYCLAGTAIMFDAEAQNKVYWDECKNLYLNETEYYTGFTAIGSEIFGITDEQGDILFNAHNTMSELFALCHVITDGAIVLPNTVSHTIRDVDFDTFGRFLRHTVEIETFSVDATYWENEIQSAQILLKDATPVPEVEHAIRVDIISHTISHPSF